jgi:hypothetical protein
MSTNITSMLGPDGKPPPEQAFRELPGQVLILDGAAMEELGCWEALQNLILGLCKEHSGNLKLVVTSIEDINAIEMALKDGSCHLGKDGTVVAIAPIADDEENHGLFYQAAPITMPNCPTQEPYNLQSPHHAQMYQSIVQSVQRHYLVSLEQYGNIMP